MQLMIEKVSLNTPIYLNDEEVTALVEAVKGHKNPEFVVLDIDFEDKSKPHYCILPPGEENSRTLLATIGYYLGV